MTSIAMSANGAETVYVGARDAGVFKTTDGGQPSHLASTSLTIYPIRSLGVDPLHPDTLYAGTDFDGIWKSTDDANTWFKSRSDQGQSPHHRKRLLKERTEPPIRPKLEVKDEKGKLNADHINLPVFP
jgi:hypothetical protein